MKKTLTVFVSLISLAVASSWLLTKWHVRDEDVFEAEVPGGSFFLTAESRRYLSERGFSVPNEVRILFRSDGVLELTNMPDCFGERSTKNFRSGVGKWKLNKSRAIFLSFDEPYVFGHRAISGGMSFMRQRTNLLLSVSVDGGKSGNYLYYEKIRS